MADDVVQRIYEHYFRVMLYRELIDLSYPLVSKMVEKHTNDYTVADDGTLMIAIEALERLKEEARKEITELSELMVRENIIVMSKEEMEDHKMLLNDLDKALDDSKELLSKRMEWLSCVKEAVLQHGKSEVLRRSEEMKNFLPDLVDKNFLPDIDSLLTHRDQDSKELPLQPDDDQDSRDNSSLLSTDNQENKNSSEDLSAQPDHDQENKDSKDTLSVILTDNQENKNSSKELSDSEDDEGANKNMRTIADIYGSSKEVEAPMEKLQMKE